MNLRRYADSDLIAALNARGYAVRRVHDARRQLVVETVGEALPEWRAAALEAIRAKITMDDLFFESVPTAAGSDITRAVLRIL